MESYGTLSTMGLLDMGRRGFAKEPLHKVFGLLAFMPVEIRTWIPLDSSLHSKRDYWQTYMKMFGILLRMNGVNALTMGAISEKCAQLPSSGPDFTSSSLVNNFGPFLLSWRLVLEQQFSVAASHHVWALSSRLTAFWARNGQY